MVKARVQVEPLACWGEYVLFADAAPVGPANFSIGLYLPSGEMRMFQPPPSGPASVLFCMHCTEEGSVYFLGHLVHPQPPILYGFQAFKSPNETPTPSHQWSFGGARGQPTPRTVGANGGCGTVPRAKNIFSTVVARPLGMLKQVFLPILSPW